MAFFFLRLTSDQGVNAGVSHSLGTLQIKGTVEVVQEMVREGPTTAGPYSSSTQYRSKSLEII